GLELYQKLVASHRAIPTVLMTAYPDERVRTQALKAHGVGYLVKPFAAEELLTLVRGVCRRVEAICTHVGLSHLLPLEDFGRGVLRVTHVQWFYSRSRWSAIARREDRQRLSCPFCPRLMLRIVGGDAGVLPRICGMGEKSSRARACM